jgi:hypothetical protein
MKNHDNKKGIKVENSTIACSATLQESRMLKNLVERLACRNYDNEFVFEKLPADWKAIETSSLEAYVSVDLTISENTEMVNVPVITCFLFTCVKEKNSKYNLTLCSSLS